MKAHRVEGLVPEMELAEAARRIVAMRTAELYAFVPEALGERAVSAMHDMRIAAKRLRYLLEMVGFCFGEVGDEAQARARRAPGRARRDSRLRRDARAHRGQPRRRARRASTPSRSASAAAAPSSFARFTALWDAIEESGLRDRLLATTFSSPMQAPWAHNPSLR